MLSVWALFESVNMFAGVSCLARRRNLGSGPRTRELQAQPAVIGSSGETPLTWTEAQRAEF